MGHSFNPTRGRYKTDADGAESLRLIKESGGTINSHAGDGQTALHAAAEHGWNDTIKMLVADGADLQPKDRLGLTPIDRANGKQPRGFLEPEHEKHTETVSLLKGYIVAATGKPPVEFTGTLNAQTRGTGQATGRAQAPAQDGAASKPADAKGSEAKPTDGKPADAKAAAGGAPNTAQATH